MPDTAAVDESKAAAFLKNTAYTGPAALWVSLHSGDPAGTGANEITSGTGSAARQAVTFTGAGGVENPTAALTFSGFAANTTATWMGLWSAQTAGTFQGGYPLVTGYRVFTAVTGGITFVCPGHSFVATNPVRFFAAPQQGVNLPSGITASTTYYVISTGLTADAFQISATSGGAALANLTSSGGGLVALDRSVTVLNTTDQIQITAANLTYTQS